MKPRTWIAIGVVWLALGLIGLEMTGCTVTPSRIDSTAASFDGAEQNSGVLSLERGGAIVTPHFRDRYVALLHVYRKAFVPSVDPKDGVAVRPDGTCWITNEVLDRMILLSEWRRMGRSPP